MSKLFCAIERILQAGAKGVVVCDLLEDTAKETIQELDKYGKERVTFAK